MGLRGGTGRRWKLQAIRSRGTGRRRRQVPLRRRKQRKRRVNKHPYRRLNFRFDIEDASAGTYYIAVSHATPDGTGNYRLRVEFSEHDCQEYIIDNGDRGTSSSGTWSVSGGPNPYDGSSLFSNQAGATYTFEATDFDTEILRKGVVDVYLWWTNYSNRCTNVQVEISDAYGILGTVDVDQQQNGGQWNKLGTYQFENLAKIKIISDGGCTTSADAVKFAEN